MIFLLALLPATLLTVAGYIVLYISNRSEGTLRSFGKYLGFWAFTLAGLVILGSLFAAASHHHRMHDWRQMHQHMYGGGPGFMHPGPMHPDQMGPPPAGGPPMPPAAPAQLPKP
jgi:ABC-type Fe3+ transport system permease subunit